MTNDFTMSVGQAHELEMAMNRVGGWDAALVKQLSTGDNLAWVRNVLKGVWEAKESNHILNLDTDPFLPPDGWTVEEHQKGGIIKWAELSIALHLDKGQEGVKSIKGNDLRQALKDQKVLNANVLDFLLKHPELIPEDWKVGKAIFFWGTIYRDSDGRPCVRYLHWHGDGWHWRYGWLISDWCGRDPAAVRAS